YGSANGIATLTRATTLAELYGPDYYGSISAVIAAVSAIGGALAPVAVAAAVDVAGGVRAGVGGPGGVSGLGGGAHGAGGGAWRRSRSQQRSTLPAATGRCSAGSWCCQDWRQWPTSWSVGPAADARLRARPHSRPTSPARSPPRGGWLRCGRPPGRCWPGSPPC